MPPATYHIFSAVKKNLHFAGGMISLPYKGYPFRKTGLTFAKSRVIVYNEEI